MPAVQFPRRRRPLEPTTPATRRRVSPLVTVSVRGDAHALLRVAHPWYASGDPTTCDLDVTALDVEPYDGRPTVVAWVTERADNRGLSITNAAEAVYSKVVGLVGPCWVVECYDERSYQVGRHHAPTYDLVELDDRGRPSWRRLGHDPADVVAELSIRTARP